MPVDTCGTKLWGTETTVLFSALILCGMLTTMARLVLMTGRPINLEGGLNRPSNSMQVLPQFVASTLTLVSTEKVMVFISLNKKVNSL